MTALSIIIPAFNAASTITRALESILDQNISSYEVLLIDDGSTDNTEKIVQEFILTYDMRIRLHHQPNLGAAIARNWGIKNAVGKFIMFLDSDDTFYGENSINLLLRAAEINGSNITGGGLVSIHGKEYNFGTYQEKLSFEKEGWIKYSDYQYDFFYQRFLFNREFLINKKIEFPNYRRFQDPPFFVKAMVESVQFYVLPIYVYCYTRSNKYLELNSEKIQGVLLGLKDLLDISSQYSLETLHEDTAKKVEKFYITTKVFLLKEYSQDIVNIYDILVYSINPELLKDKNYIVRLHNCSYVLKKLKNPLFRKYLNYRMLLKKVIASIR